MCVRALALARGLRIRTAQKSVLERRWYDVRSFAITFTHYFFIDDNLTSGNLFTKCIFFLCARGRSKVFLLLTHVDECVCVCAVGEVRGCALIIKRTNR